MSPAPLDRRLLAGDKGSSEAPRGPAWPAGVEYVFDWFARPSRRRGRPARPTILNLPITDNCNSRCVMCDVWKTKSTGEVTAESLRAIFADPLFLDLRHVGISGGEPSLRRDLAECVESVVSSLPKLRSLSITSHGFHTARWRELLPAIREACREKGIAFVLNLSLDGIGDTHDAVRGIPGSYDRVLRTLRLAQGLGVRVQLQATLSGKNAYSAAQLLETATAELTTDILFRVATVIPRLDNQSSMRAIGLSAKQRSFLADFFSSDGLHSATPSPARRLFYRDLAHRLADGGPRRAPCYYQSEGLLLDPHGEMYHCSISQMRLGNAMEASPTGTYFGAGGLAARDQLMTHVCTACVHDQSGAWTPGALAVEVVRGTPEGRRFLTTARKAWGLLEGAPSALFPGVRTGGRTEGSSRAEGGGTVLCMGMYGGEHVGDAATLGGVLHRVSRRYGAGRAIVLSFRPHRTRRWIAALDLPMPVEIVPYTSADGALTRSDRLVLAGGPVMDLPSVLLPQIKVAAAAVRSKKPFIAEGIGIGPLNTPFGVFLARRLLRLAERIDVRSAASAQSSDRARAGPQRLGRPGI